MNRKSGRTVSHTLLTPEVEGILDALGDGTRRRILARLGERPLPVVELAGGLPVSRPAVSQHLRVLKQAGLVSVQALGNRRYYALDPQGLATLRRCLEGFWQDALARFAAAAARAGEEDPMAATTAMVSGRSP